jgi:hypothetical protein
MNSFDYMVAFLMRETEEERILAEAELLRIYNEFG